MSQEKHDLGREYYKKVYADTLPEMPERGEFAFFDYMLDEIKTNDQFSVRESSMLNQVNDWLTSIISSDNLEIFKFIFETIINYFFYFF